MATTATIKKNIAKLEAALKSKATPKSLKPKLETQLVKSKAELSGMNKGTKPKTSSTKSTQTALQKLKAMVNKNKKYKTYKGAGVDLEKDADRPALKTGKRIAKESGKTYYEYRANRIDVKQPPKKYPKLEKGGYMAKGGITREGNHLMHFEPYFEKNVQVASINEDLKIIRPSHGYWHPNKIGKKSIAWAKRNGYKFIQDGKEFEKGGYMADGGKLDEMAEKYQMWLDKNNLPQMSADELLVDESVNLTKEQRKYIQNFSNEWNEEQDKYAKGGMSQGYDDREDERLGMKDGKMSLKDLDSTHARRDDAQFEEIMARGGQLEVGDMVMVDDSGYVKYFSGFDTNNPAKIISKDKGKSFGKVKYFYGLETADGKKPFNQAIESMLTKVSKDGGMMAKGGFVGKGELVWRKLTDSKKMEFLKENFTPQITPRSQEILVGKDFQFLPKDVKIKLESKYANVEEYAKGGMSQDEESILVYYVNHYPEDELALEIKAKATFNGLYEVLSNKGDAYEYIGVADSIVRERVFEKLAKIKGVKYDVIYDMWMDSDYAKGGFVGKGELVWRKLTDSKKMEFLKENFTPQITPRSQEILVGKDFQFLPKDVKIKLESKYANVEEYAKGGISQKEVVESNAEMVLSQIKAVKHHAQELSNVVSKNSDIEAWVVAKIERASTDLSDITHYLEFQTKKMAMGGEIHRTQD